MMMTIMSQSISNVVVVVIVIVIVSCFSLIVLPDRPFPIAYCTTEPTRSEWIVERYGKLGFGGRQDWSPA
jgi:hypothetical protein